MKIKSPSETIFHSIEAAIKAYRKMAQDRISECIDHLTIDQSLTLLYIQMHPELNQSELAELLFKDNASLTRMIKSMVKHGYLERKINPEDLRRYKLDISKKGEDVLVDLPDTINSNRSKALEGVTEDEERELKRILNKIISNCKNQQK